MTKSIFGKFRKLEKKKKLLGKGIQNSKKRNNKKKNDKKL